MHWGHFPTQTYISPVSPDNQPNQHGINVQTTTLQPLVYVPRYPRSDVSAWPPSAISQANREEQKSGGGGGGGGGRSTSNSPSRQRGFQRRLEEASAEISAESAAAPQIASTTTRRDTATTVESRGRGGSGGSGGSVHHGWTVREDRVLEHLVRECVFDFDLVAARISSATDDARDARDEGE